MPAGIGGLIVARLFLGAGEGMVYTAGLRLGRRPRAARPPRADHRPLRARDLGRASLGPPIGELILHATSFEGVWAFAAGAPLLGALIATRIPERYEPRPLGEHADRRWIAREALRPGLGLALAIVGYATVAAFIVLHLDERAGRPRRRRVHRLRRQRRRDARARRLAPGPLRLGPVRDRRRLLEAGGLLLLAFTHSLAEAIVGAVAMGAGFSLLFPSLALVVINRVPEERRGAAMGTFTAFFDLGVGVGSPIAGAAAALGGYEAAFLRRRGLRARRDRGRAVAAGHACGGWRPRAAPAPP